MAFSPFAGAVARRALMLAALLLMLVFAAGLAPGRAAADPPDPAANGALMLQDGTTGPLVEAIRLGTDIDVDVTGQIQRVRVTQMFRNTTDHWVEATYLYPLPQDGAVDELRIVVGGRVIVGEIQPREQARQTYEEARANGQRAGLIEQQRPNMFTTQVANIGPHETVLVQIEYQAPVRQTADGSSLRVPLVVGPRYTPPQGTGSAQPETIAAPVLDPRTHLPINPVSITVRLAPGFVLGEVESPYHRINARQESPERQTITLADGLTPANRDFELRWAAAPGEAQPQARLFVEHRGESDFVMATISPPSVRRREPAQPREMIYVIDNSGSMEGESMRQAKAGLLYALTRLRPGDTFNIVRFDNTLETVFPQSVPADAEHLTRARTFVDALQAAGGTEMVPALQRALNDDRSEDRRLRQVIFMTDGAISNEQEMFNLLGANLGRSRVFMVGIGSAPNTHLMSRMAELGRGTFTHIGDAAEVEARMRSLLDTLDTPAATNLTARFSFEGAEVAPGVLPDLYAGEPVVLTARVPGVSGELTLTGDVSGRPWRVVLPLDRAEPGRGISRLWARRRIEDAEVGVSTQAMTREQADARILELAMAHHLVSSQTSLVAVDRTPVRPRGEPLTSHDVPLNLPAGWDFDAVFGGEHPNPPNAARGGQGDQTQAVDLPQTGTDGVLWLVFGLALSGSALLVLVGAMRRPARAAA